MYQIDNSSVAGTLPASTAIGTVGYFTDGNPATAIPATVVPAEFMNMLMVEMLGVISAAGITPSKATNNQLASAISTIIQGSTTVYAADTGTANTYLAAYTPVITAPVEGMKLGFLAKSASTGPSTFNGLPLLNARYGAMQANQIAVGSICTVQYVRTLSSWVLRDAAGNAVPSTISGYGITDAYTKAQVDAITGSQTKVVSNPTVTGSSSVTTGTVVTLTATASSLLNGGTIASFTWTLPDGTTSTTVASSGSATKNVTATGSIGTNYIVKVIATDNAGNTSQQVSKSIAITNHAAPTAPTTLTVASTVYQNSTGNILTVSGSVATDGATITYSLTQSGAVGVTFSQTTGIAAGAQVTFTAPAVAADTPIVISATAVDSMGGVSAATTANVTIAAVPTQAGVAYGGGYYVSRMLAAGQNYALIVAPKASGELAAYSKNSNSTSPGMLSSWNGSANTAAMLAAGGSPAATFVTGLTIGGFTDWAVPADDQLELLYRMYKPNTTANDTSSGANSSSNPVGSNYTSGNPARTSVAAFISGGSEAFQAAMYETSTETGSANGYLYFKMFDGGGRIYGNKTDGGIVRAVRMIKI